MSAKRGAVDSCPLLLAVELVFSWGRAAKYPVFIFYLAAGWLDDGPRYDYCC